MQTYLIGSRRAFWLAPTRKSCREGHNYMPKRAMPKVQIRNTFSSRCTVAGVKAPNVVRAGAEKRKLEWHASGSWLPVDVLKRSSRQADTTPQHTTPKACTCKRLDTQRSTPTHAQYSSESVRKAGMPVVQWQRQEWTHPSHSTRSCENRSRVVLSERIMSSTLAP